MITQYQFSLQAQEPLPSFWAYRLYASILELIPDEDAEFLHQQGEKPLSHFLQYNKNDEASIWTINLLSEEMDNIFAPVLDHLSQIELDTGLVQITRSKKESISGPEKLLSCSKENPSSDRYHKLFFKTPTAFKQSGRYTIFPTVPLLLQSMVNKWNQAFPQLILEDEEALHMLESGLFLTDYSLRSCRYPLKNVKIPGFVGSITMESRLSPPMLELWKLLLAIAPYSGIGIKTTLGMGGTETGIPF